MDELFVTAFKTLIQLGGSGWLVAGMFLLGVIYLYRENGKTRDRAEAISERTVIALERVTAVNRDVATTLEGSIRSREELVRLLSEVARRGESDGKRILEELAALAVTLRSVESSTKDVGRCFDRVYEGQGALASLIHGYQVEVARVSGLSPPPSPLQQARLGSGGGS